MRRFEGEGPRLSPAVLLVGAVLSGAIWSGAPAAETRGQAEWTTQGYYFGVNGERSGLSGVAFRFQHFVDGAGLLQGALEGYEGRRRAFWGENYLELRETPWLDHRWSFTGGDFRLPLRGADFPASGWYFPELNLRGIQLTAKRGGREYSAFYGAQTLSVGPRISYRLTTPYRIAGVSFRYGWRDRLRLGLTAFRVAANPSRAVEEPYSLPLEQRYRAASHASLQASFKLHKHVQFFGEGAFVRPEGAKGPLSRVSGSVGGAWDSPKLTAQLSYQRQGSLYLPVAGYLAGDRAGPLAELRYRPVRGVQLHVSDASSSNNLNRDPDVLTFRSRSRSAGGAFELPGGFSLGGELSSLRFEVRPPGLDPERSANRLRIAYLGRGLGRHYLRATVRELTLRGRGPIQRQRSFEVEDSVHWRGASLGGAVRLDRSVQSETRNSVLVRMNAQWRLRKATVFGQFEVGRDLLSSSVFTTSAVKTFVAGASASLGRGWSLQAEVFRHDLNLSLNPANLFLLESRGIPYPIVLSGFNQWSCFVRLTKSLHWGGPMPSQGLEQWAAERLPIAGTIEGLAIEVSRTGNRPAPGVTIRLDENRTTVTDAAGRYRFTDVPEGEHTLALEMRSLPAEYQPRSPAAMRVSVRARAATRQDFQLTRLADLCGKVQAPPGFALEAIVLVLEPSGLRTTPEADGNYCFYNVPEGPYEIQIDHKSLPDGLQVEGPDRIPVLLEQLSAGPAPVFRLESRPAPAKPVRRILLSDTGVPRGAGDQ